MVTSAKAPFVSTYASEVAYMSVQEFLDTPTALSIKDLIPDGNDAQQTAALAAAIRRASSWVDDIVNMSLACSPNIERDWYRVDRYGCVRIPTLSKPVLEVTAVSVGNGPTSMTAMTSLSAVNVNKNVVEVPVGSAALPSTGSRVLVDLTYLSGYPLTATSGTTNIGGVSLPVTSAVGVYPGSTLAVRDGASTEYVTVAPSYTSGLALPLTSGMTFAHAAGITVDALPSRVKDACALLTCAIIQARGNDAIILDAMEQPSRMSDQSGSLGANVDMAKELLTSLSRVW